jgi:hypothetical protein
VNENTQYGQAFIYRLNQEEITSGRRKMIYERSATSNDCGTGFPGRNRSFFCKLINCLPL